MKSIRCLLIFIVIALTTYSQEKVSDNYPYLPIKAMAFINGVHQKESISKSQFKQSDLMIGFSDTTVRLVAVTLAWDCESCDIAERTFITNRISYRLLAGIQTGAYLIFDKILAKKDGIIYKLSEVHLKLEE